MRIYIGNLPIELSEKDLARLFAVYGTVDSAVIVPSGHAPYGFVVMPSDSEGRAAIDALDGRELFGRPINVYDAAERVIR